MYTNLLLTEIDQLDIDNQHTSVSKHLSQWANDICDCDVAPGNFVQHRRKEKELLLGY